ncbi:molybdenum cofactor biosynthesis protein MoaA [Candidatus Geothermarchaeota archaeon ex4572_27]|nr:MAG: molybdenum cofactor biosynthesis protein MoaA [Candidatus Geothermarchaeota archaeon ex4572_27]
MAELVRIPDDVEAPLLGCICFGIIDRGTNVLQVRPTTICPLSCIFCSVDSGPKSRSRQAEFVVSPDYLLEAFREAVKVKGEHGIEAHIDTVGDPLTHPKIVDIVQGLASTPGVEVVSMQTHGALLTERLAEELADAGLSRVNLSIDALDVELARRLADTPSYDVRRVAEVAEFIARSTRMDVLIAPVWVPGVNDQEIVKIIEFAVRIGAGKRWPPLGIQKMEVHRRGRRPRGVKEMTWYRFYSELRELERRMGVKLVLTPQDFGIHKRPRIPQAFKRFERVKVRVIGPGWLKGEKLGEARGRAVTLVDADHIRVGSTVSATIIEVKDGLYIARAAI